MARVFAFATHTVRWQPKKGASLEDYVFPVGTERDVPEELAKMVTGAHPQKLKLLAEHEPAPALTGAYADTSMGNSPANRMLSQDNADLCLRQTKAGGLCQSAKPCRWHK